MLHIDSGGSNSDEPKRLKELNVFSQVDHFAGICVLIFSYVTCVVYCGGILKSSITHSPIVFRCVLSLDLVF
jgi:hypothetical protein